MASKAPQAAFVEDFDEDAHASLPETRQVANANTAAKLSRLDLRFPEPLIDGASDSGYSSRTAATVNSTQSGPSGGKSPPVPLKLDTTLKRSDLPRKSSTRKDRKEKDRAPRSAQEEKMVGAYPGSAHYPHVPRSPSKSRRRDSSHARHYHDSGYEYASGLYYPSTAVEPRVMEYSRYIPQRPPVPDYLPSSPRTPRYSPAVVQDINVSRSSDRPGRSNSYHTYHSNARPMSFHGMLPGMGPAMYSQPSMHPYEQHGPPPASSAYANPPSYSSSPYGASSYYAGSEFAPPLEYPRERSPSRTREPSRPRRSSMYGPPAVDSGVLSPWFDDDEPLERWSSREARGRGSVKPSQERDEDFYLMPPPPPPPPKRRAPPQIIQQKRPDPPRKSQTSSAVPSQRRPSRTLEMPELAAVLPDYGNRRMSRETAPERSHSLRESPRSTSYHDSRRAARVAVESSGRRRAPKPESNVGLADREREVEKYQAARSGRGSAATPLTAEALLPTKAANRTGSESGSQKSRSNSSRGSGTGSKAEEDKNMTLMMNGMTIGFTQESVAGKSINIRTGDTGAVRFSIEGSRQPKNYLTGPNYSEYTGSSGRRELEDGRGSRDDRKSDRASRRSSRSTYSSGRYRD
ncbi:hypothetical protein NUU61_008498 [Penicillium alfredii]|uniref:Uncharacterized protein n=1 Tax=Penicillium alfredii TaxID=1506179 RepID=A0A9W9ELJ0_9EURO|nr:uncharacterized protein NUU61_008498 [Penicillium alfredii]KAJ5083919.1 hypothetical protein NUU61_008498 [Penicillium alfredii]